MTDVQLGELTGRLFLAAIAIGLLRTFTRRDLNWRQKVFGWRNPREPRP